MKPGDALLTEEIRQSLISFQEDLALPGIQSPGNSTCLIQQIVDSTKRIKYISAIKERAISPLCINPNELCFNPLKAAIWHQRNNSPDEAFWLVFLFTHFGKNKRTGWQLIRDIYRGPGNGLNWTWANITHDPENFLLWLEQNRQEIRHNGSFGNHRKYESLNAYSPNGTGSAIVSYINWVQGPLFSHEVKINNIINQFGDNPRELFARLYQSMNSVARFGRTGRFDYLTMIGKLGLANIEPDSTYMDGATGPLSGARLLFGGAKDSIIRKNELHEMLVALEAHLGLYFGMQVLEDALCNWQKSPGAYEYYSG